MKKISIIGTILLITLAVFLYIFISATALKAQPKEGSFEVVGIEN